MVIFGRSHVVTMVFYKMSLVRVSQQPDCLVRPLGGWGLAGAVAVECVYHFLSGGVTFPLFGREQIRLFYARPLAAGLEGCGVRCAPRHLERWGALCAQTPGAMRAADPVMDSPQKQPWLLPVQTSCPGQELHRGGVCDRLSGGPTLCQKAICLHWRDPD